VNAASAYHLGGGILTGGRHALEESWCAVSTLLKGMIIVPLSILLVCGVDIVERYDYILLVCGVDIAERYDYILLVCGVDAEINLTMDYILMD
jgi:hypothetical protein